MLQDVPFSSGAKLTIEPRGQIVLLGINRPYMQNRIVVILVICLGQFFEGLRINASPRAAIPFGHGENFSRGIYLRVAFLMKDLMILAASFYLLKQDVVRAFVAAVICRNEKGGQFELKGS
jgi:hypothetical protein